MTVPDHKTLEEMYRVAVTIRLLEEKLLGLFSEGKLSGTTHTYLGQEGLAAAMAGLLRPDDVIFSSHRCHGHYVTYGGPLEGLLGEVMGRACGVSGGRGGSQHLHYRRFFSSGVQGGIAGNATGAALALQHKGEDGIAIVFLGDGTLGEGLVYESLNFAQLRKLPVLFVVEDNGIAQTTPVELAVSGGMAERARAFGMAAQEVESNDAVLLREVMTEAIGHVRAGKGPFFQVVHTCRMGPHSKGDDTRPPEALAPWREKDPLQLLEQRLTPEAVARIRSEAEAALAAALAVAEQSPPSSIPTHESLLPSTSQPAAPPWATRQESCVSALNRGLHALFDREPRSIMLGEDLLDPYGGAFKVSAGLSTAHPERVITTPISEAGIAAWATGAALLGLRPVAEFMFGDFIALAADQLLNHVPKYPWVTDGAASLPLVLRCPMGGRRGYGPTHSQCIEKHFLGVDGLRVIALNPITDPGELLQRAAALDSPTLVIENKVMYAKPLMPCVEGRIGDFMVRTSEHAFPAILMQLADAPCDAVLVTYGGMVSHAMEAAERMMLDDERHVAVLVLTQLSPLPLSVVASLLPTARALITVEEAHPEGGWGGEFIAALCCAGRTFPRVARVGARCGNVPAARILEDAVLPDVDAIIRAVEDVLA
ncbi:MAG: hypothetical protein RLZZ303_3323 [Candidatus Hydrogenedentota bacterium]|jgi:2-oxoisovalerate dehydrogenase E1 component